MELAARGGQLLISAVRPAEDPATDDQQPRTRNRGTIFNRRTTSAADLTEDEVAEDLDPLDLPGTMTVFVALFYMYGTKVGAIKHRTGIE
jgi:hypothetical protein